jgi:hypothetical protein
VQVVVLLLLVAGLALLVLGLITGSTPLVVASIAASLLAAVAILRYRRREQASSVVASSEPAGIPPAPAPEEAQDGPAARVRTAGRAPTLASVSAEPAAEPVQVAVPPAHAAEPAHAEPAHAEPAHAEPAHAEPENRADTDTDPEPAEADTDPPLRSRGDEPVWVIDGRPRYHLPGCAFLLGREPERVPLRQAVEDGFTPCAQCDPDSGLVAR